MPQNIDALKMVFEAYADFARLLRTWLVAFGIGGPIIFLNIKDAYEILRASPYKSFVIAAFLIGLALQILSALLYKWVLWYVFAGSLRSGLRSNRIYRFSVRLAGIAWPGVIADIGAILLFGAATVLCAKALF